MDRSVEPRQAGRVVGPHLFAGLAAFGLTWGTAAMLSWHTWFGASAWWAAQRRIATPALETADARLFLEDAVVTTLVGAGLLVVVALAFRRIGRRGFVVLWGLVGLGALLWAISFLAAPRLDQIMVAGRCTYSDGPTESDGVSGIDVRGWSWTRFSLIVVRTGSRGTDEVACR
jgi:hypothetical protein